MPCVPHNLNALTYTSAKFAKDKIEQSSYALGMVWYTYTLSRNMRRASSGSSFAGPTTIDDSSDIFLSGCVECIGLEKCSLVRGDVGDRTYQNETTNQAPTIAENSPRHLQLYWMRFVLWILFFPNNLSMGFTFALVLAPFNHADSDRYFRRGKTVFCFRLLKGTLCYCFSYTEARRVRYVRMDEV